MERFVIALSHATFFSIVAGKKKIDDEKAQHRSTFLWLAGLHPLNA